MIFYLIFNATEASETDDQISLINPAIQNKGCYLVRRQDMIENVFTMSHIISKDGLDCAKGCYVAGLYSAVKYLYSSVRLGVCTCQITDAGTQYTPNTEMCDRYQQIYNDSRNLYTYLFYANEVFWSPFSFICVCSNCFYFKITQINMCADASGFWSQCYEPLDGIFQGITYFGTICFLQYFYEILSQTPT